MSLDVEAARTAVQTVADAMGLASVEEAAEGILAIVNENMAGALRLVSVQRGHDPRDFALVAYGGAGPLHANAVAKLMGSFPVLVPPAPGLLCAIGDLVADFRDEFAQTYIRLLSEADAERGRRRSSTSSAARATAWLESEGIAAEARSITFTADMRYHGQGYEIPVAIDPAEIALGRARRPRGALQRPPRAALRVPHARHRRARSSTCAPSASAPCRSPSCPSATPAAQTRGRRRRRAPGRVRRRARARRRSTTARSSSPGCASTAPRSSPSSTRRPSSSPATRPRST